jgi:hypothetical protein
MELLLKHCSRSIGTTSLHDQAIVDAQAWYLVLSLQL